MPEERQYTSVEEAVEEVVKRVVEALRLGTPRIEVNINFSPSSQRYHLQLLLATWRCRPICTLYKVSRSAQRGTVCPRRDRKGNTARTAGGGDAARTTEGGMSQHQR